jgi:hypothetical protein
MDEKVKEIEKSYREEHSITWLDNSIEYLLSHIENLQSHADKLGEIIHGQTMKRFELEARIKELEEG